ncbi:branched-chain amino acid ABC transporter ATP-binding protein/permease [Micromonospora zingiberis]|uniref:Branched-chain amino acid ABC transporter ATP-binding protein/permease n=1 Tax=Micromonospora zingiberis TaxID=2053011 RepID=A0A4R0GLG1_9ACTN|nr:branched-chain amino acid ABC transporter ATP-binding protein/permease [Micromonospora zingiberis]TCB97223.1 branched-chain amino acid ABC transporter ATP-binding protein/permease [Micromonospora zingiberis]
MNTMQKVAASAVVRHLAAPVVLVVVGLATAGNDYYLHLATAAGIAYILTAAFNLIYGYAGIFNLSIIMTYGLGAFTSVYLEVHYGVSFWLALLVAVVVTSTLSVLVALPSKSLGELFLAIQTLAFALALGEILLSWEEFSGGTIGIYIIPSPSLFGLELIGGYQEFYWLTAVFALLTFQLMRNVHRSGTGRKLVALREGPRILASVGVSPGQARLVAFGLSGMLAGLAGALYAHFQLVIDLDTFSFHRLVALLLATILGGAGYFFGPVFGVLAILVMDELSLVTSQAQDLIYGVGILVLVVATRGGIAGAFQRLVARFTPARQRSGPLTTASGSGEQRNPQRVAEQLAEEGPRRQVTVTDLAVSFGGTRAVDNVSITFATGEVVGLIGPNGAGKTTLLNAVTGDVPTAAGAISLDGDRLLGRRQQDIVRMGISRTFQSPKVIPELTLLENVMLAGDGLDGPGWVNEVLRTPGSIRHDRRSRERAMALLDDLSLAGRADQLVGDQPYGVQRLVEIARNLMLQPSFLLLDEPGAGLTEFERAEVAEVVRALSHRQIGVVLVDHNLSLINAACDRVYVLDSGRLIADGPPAEVFARQQVISAYLGVPG